MLVSHPFFPDPVLAWIFCGVLVGLTGMATYTDLRRMMIPKALTLLALALGVVINLIRGAWMGASGHAVWILGERGAWLGMVDGLLFTVAGFLVGFNLFLLLYVLGTCGGGDVKLFAALGAWIGPGLVIPVLLGTIVLVIVLSVLRLAAGVRGTRPARQRDAAAAQQTRKRLMAYSLPVALSTACVLLWVFRAELRLPGPQAERSVVQGTGVRP